MPPNSDPGVIEPGQSQTINPIFIDPNQKTFQSFNPNLPSNMYGNVTTGRSDYKADSNVTSVPYWSSPEARMGRLPTQAPVNNTNPYYNNENIAMSNLGVGGDDASFANPSSTGSYGGSLMTGGPSPAPPPTSGGGADGVGQLGAVGDFFGGIGDAIGVTNYAEQAETPEAKARAKSESDSGTSGGK